MFDITATLGAISAFFGVVIGWMQVHGFIIGDWFISFFDFAIGSVVIITVMWIFLPWIGDFADDEDD